MAIALPVWVFVSFLFAQAFVIAVLALLQDVGVDLRLLNVSVLETAAAALVYLVCLVVVVLLPWAIWRYRTDRRDLGLRRLVSWMDIGLAPAGFIIYLLASGGVTYMLSKSIPGFDANEPQQIGFQDLSRQYEYVLAFVTLVIIAPVAEEAIFRGYLYGKLRKAAPLWVTVAITSLLFAVLHMRFDNGSLVGVNVAIDVFILSLVMCSLREITGNIWAGILLHMMKNGLAFYLLFINTALLSTMGG